MDKPAVGIFGLTGCAGDQLVVLNCEDELLDLVGLLDLRDFLTAASGGDTSCRLDVALVEGAVVSARDEAALHAIRERAATLVAIGTCAVWGGLPAMDRDVDVNALVADVYGPIGAAYDRLPARALHEVVPVEHRLAGCPIEKTELLAAVACLVRGLPPPPHATPVCVECRMREIPCLLADGREPCLGPLTEAGCDARCPAYGIPCIGCRGPVVDANPGSAVAAYERCGLSPADAVRKLRTFAAVAGNVTDREAP